MEEVKKLFKRMGITALLFLSIGAISRNQHLAFGATSGCLVSILSLYMLSIDTKSIAYCKDLKVAKKIAVLGFAKRYILHFAFFAVLLYFLDFKYFISAVIGVFSLRFNIYIIAVEQKLKKFRKE